MRFEFSIANQRRVTDVAITAPGGTPPPDLRAAVAEAAAACGVPLPDPPLPRTGAVLPTFREADEQDRSRLAVYVASGRGAGDVRRLRPGRVLIGRAEGCDLVLDDAAVSRRHAALVVGRRSVTVRDLTSTNGSQLDGLPVTDAPAEFRPGQLLEVGRTTLGLLAPDEEQRACTAVRGDVVVVPGSARARPPHRPPTIEMPTADRSPAPRHLSVVAALLPAVLGGAIAWYTGSLQFLLFAALSPLMFAATAVGDRVHWRRSRRRAAIELRRAQAAAHAEIVAAVAAEEDYLRRTFPDPAHIRLVAALPTARLWERSAADANFLRVRLGTAVLPAQARVRHGDHESSAGSIRAAPVCVDLRAGPLAICGPDEATAAMARSLMAQLAALHPPGALRLALLLGHDDDSWHWARWLPHLADRVAVGADEITRLSLHLTDPADQQHPLVVIVDDAGAAWEHAGRAGDLNRVGQVIYLARNRQSVPAQCAHLVVADDPAAQRAVLQDSTDERLRGVDFVPDQVSCQWAEEVARALAPLRDASTPISADDACPTLCDLLEIGAPDPDRIRAQWEANGFAPRTVIGIGNDAPVVLDLVTDGPHCLVAGTTGAGKSELLRTLVTGLALNCPPTAVSFVLIDYKGGAAFAACAALPHTCAVVTDLDAQLTRRALRSLDAELRHREGMLAAARVSDVDAFHRIQSEETLPRLVVVVDEFAALAEELPAFVKGLINIAQRGRSLGVHLVLATQRPGRAVTPEITANTSLRIALRVTDAAESAAVIDAPDAAGIPARRPGSAYLRRGAELVAFHTALARPQSARDVRVEVLGPWRRPLRPASDESPSDALGTVVAAIRSAADRAGIAAARTPWLPPLPGHLVPRRAPAPAGTIALGTVDLPDEQRQAPLPVDLRTGGSLIACGASGSGRSTLLLGAALRVADSLPPTTLEIYVLERGRNLASALDGLPHLASAVSVLEEPELAGGLLRRLSAPAPTDACRLLLIDDWDAVVGSVGQVTGAELTDALANLVRTAVERRLTVLTTGDRPLLAARWTSSSTRLALRLADRGDYALAGVAARDVPSAMPPGRGVRAEDGAEFQVFAVPGAVRDEVSSLARRWITAEPSRTAVRLRALPTHSDLDRCAVPPAGLRLGVGGDTAAPVAIDPFAAGHLVVAGPPRSGRTTVLGTLLAECVRTGTSTVVAAPPRSPLHDQGRALGMPVVGPGAPPESVQVPAEPTVLLVDDCAAFDDVPAGEYLTAWLRSGRPIVAIVAGRTDDLASAYRGLGAEARRSRCGLLLQPGPIDGELFGVRLRRNSAPRIPGRGLLIGVPGSTRTDAERGCAGGWIALDTGEPVPIQVARSEVCGRGEGPQPPAMWGYR